MGASGRERTDASDASTASTASDASTAIAALRRPAAGGLPFRGLGPLVAGIILFVLMLALAPSVAPEHLVPRPVSTTSTTVPGG